MKVFQLPPFTAAILFTAICMGFLALFVLLPIFLIQWVWNFFVIKVSVFPEIGLWQAALLYVAFTISLFLLGFLQIDIEAKKFE